MVGRYILQCTVSRVFDLRNLFGIPRPPNRQEPARMRATVPLWALYPHLFFM